MGFRLAEVARMSVPGVKSALIVVRVMFLIGCLTGLWRCSGTIAYFITEGIGVLPPSLFVLSAFLLTALMSMAIGTSFGVVATAGVIIMSIARAADIDLLPVAGAVMSGIYIGDRNSPAASSASLVAAVTGTELNRNIRIMLRTSAVPVLICVVIYSLLSFVNPMHSFDSETIRLLQQNFRLNAVCILPAVIMLVLPLLKVKVQTAMIIDIIISFLIGVFVQSQSFSQVMSAMVLGYESEIPQLSALLNGGGIKSMISVCIILIISGTFGEIMQGTGMLDKAYLLIDSVKNRIGVFGTTILLSIISCMLFCNQTIGVMMTDRLSSRLYKPEEKYRKMIDLEDSVILIAGLVPWCIACSVPLTTMGVGPKALLYACYLWIVPIWRLIRGRAYPVIK